MDILYRARVTAVGGRQGGARSEDGLLDLKLMPPRELGGAGGGTNPEQLLAAGYSACFISALDYVARQWALPLPEDYAVTAEVGLGRREGESGLGLAVVLHVSLPGVPSDAAEELVEGAHHISPFSHAMRGNVQVETRLAPADTARAA